MGKLAWVKVHSRPAFWQLYLLVATDFMLKVIKGSDRCNGVSFVLARVLILLLRGAGRAAMCLSVRGFGWQKLMLRAIIVCIAVQGLFNVVTTKATLVVTTVWSIFSLPQVAVVAQLLDLGGCRYWPCRVDARAVFDPMSVPSPAVVAVDALEDLTKGEA